MFWISTFGQTVVWTNPINGTNPATANPYSTGQTANANITVSGIGFSSPALTGVTSTNTYNVGDWTTSASINTTQYFFFTITPATGYKVSMSSFVYTGTSGSRAPTSFAFRSDANGDSYLNNIGTPTAAGTTISLTGANYQNLTSATSFRFYGYNSSGGSASARSYAINDFTFNGSILGSATTALAFGAANPYGSAPVQGFKVNGYGLIPANGVVTISGSANYEVSTTSALSGFGPTATLTATGGNISGENVWVRLKATASVGTYNENITFGGGGVTGITIACSGTVTTANLTITADNAEKCFGTSYILGTTAFTTSALQNGETVGSVTLSSTGAILGAAAGSYAITPSVATGGTFTASNYNITYTNGTLVVNALPVSPLGTNGNICSTGTVSLSASANVGEAVDWYDTAIGGTLLLSNSTNYTTPSISSTTIYYAEARNTTTGCVSVNRTPVTATVYNAFAPGSILTSGEVVCYNGDPISIGNATPATGGDETITYVWQANGVDIPSSNVASYNPPAGLIVNTTYTRYAKDNTCNTTFTLSGGSWVVTLSNDNTWTGGVSTAWTNPANWSCGVVPENVSNVTIASAAFYPEISSNVSINTLTLNSGTTLKVNSLYDLTVTNAIDNSGTLTVENNANLIQINDVANTGSGVAVVKRNSSAIMRLDYTLWSSPVTGQGLYAFSPFTFANRFYTYNTSSNTYSSVSGFNITGLNGAGVNGIDNNNVQFTTGLGYLIRMPYNHPTAPATWTGTFTGTLNNGTKTVALNNAGSGLRYNLVGNPYPSPIDAIALVTDTNNAANITGTLYFLRKTNGSLNSSYSTWTQGGFVTNGGTAVFDPNDVIQTGQGFFVEATATGSTLEFNNSMRINDHANQFFRNNTIIEKNRIWLNATNATGLYSQTMIGYITNATNGIDNSIDGRYLSDGDIALTSLIDTTPYAIQGRALPFDNTDVVPLNFRVTNAGQYTIAIDHVDGLFVNGQDVFLRDNLSSVVHNLNAGGYTFTSDAGTFASRFEILYQLPLTVVSPVFNANQVVVYKNGGDDFVINSGNVIMATVKVFDIRGRLLLEKNEINNSETSISAGHNNEVLLIQITSQDGLVVTKKVIR
ncbi:T9SS sorting signal type C domain-containing protein [Flavobacterium sp. J49]|uniref:beta strand repeat-containing protein n=1 Tax=Flavobacterium sp. J49 TaxID=2718534 RepID=UPI0015943051|nr:T9SS sorting signal type C domain-containing protein [Flavobacterium sp. J49]MBF6641031.1 T9SS sorting signal type C domain-containing protein [Flavobacterium sp. J49]NIC02278.1 T9SS sorting signal type C domain-containing protein [Flavobacterium sp. J49]